MAQSQPTFLLAAGGTGGHLFPAEALAAELGRRGAIVDLATDERADKYGRAFPARAIHIIPSATFGSKNPLALIRSGLTLARGLAQANALLSRIEPAAVIGFGGYPTFPPVLAAQNRRLPTILHEANAVMGRANRALAWRATAIATSFPTVERIGKAAARATQTGNPVRDMVLAARRPYSAPEPDDPIRLMVFGGSQGARVFSDTVPAAIAALPEAIRSRLAITQQCRAEDLERVRAAYAGVGLAPELAPFFVDLPSRMADAHLIICRSGASTVAELGVIGRPAILVPFAFALDADQSANARILAAAGGAIVVAQTELTPARLAAEITGLIAAPDRLAAIAAAAAAQGRPDAVARLADLVQSVAARRAG